VDVNLVARGRWMVVFNHWSEWDPEELESH